MISLSKVQGSAFNVQMFRVQKFKINSVRHQASGIRLQEKIGSISMI